MEGKGYALTHNDYIFGSKSRGETDSRPSIDPFTAPRRDAVRVTPCEPTAIAVVLRTCFAYREALAEQSALAHSCEPSLASLDYLPQAKFPCFQVTWPNRLKDLTKNGTTKVVPFFA